MNWPIILHYATGVSTVLSFCSLAGVLYFWTESKKVDRSLYNIILGEQIPPKHFLAILKQFKDDELRGKALAALMHRHQDEGLALLKKVKRNIDPIQLELQQKRSYFHRLAAALVFFVTMAFTFVVAEHSHSAPESSEAGKCSESHVARLEGGMQNNLKENLYDDVETLADQALMCKDYYYPWFYKGSVAFYTGRYNDAVVYFTKVIQRNPPNLKIYKRNLADAYMETGGVQIALGIYQSINDGSEAIRYRLGRAYLYADQYSDAIRYLETVQTLRENPPGSARILEAAAYAGLAKAATGSLATSYREKAREKLHIGINQKRDFWERILSGQEKWPNEGFEKATKLLEPVSAW